MAANGTTLAVRGEGTSPSPRPQVVDPGNGPPYGTLSSPLARVLRHSGDLVLYRARGAHSLSQPDLQQPNLTLSNT